MASTLRLTASDQYTILSELGKGGFGKVFYVQSKADPDFKCAVKAVDLERIVGQVNTPEEKDKHRKMALEEAEKMRKAEHPFIVRVFASFLEGDTFYIAMEYCDGGTLKQAIRRQKGEHFGERKILLWTAQLALTLKFLHDKNILHRDIKSDNVFLIGNGEIVKLGDFGIAKSLDKSTAGHTLVGTVTHMPPEMFQDKPYRQESEVWELGIVVYELCALELPFEQGPGGLAGLMSAICLLPIKPLPEKYSPELRSLVIDKMLERDFEKRPWMLKIIGDQCIASATVELMPIMATFYSNTPVKNIIFDQNPQLAVVPLAFRDANYYKKWKPTRRILFKNAPSVIEAILPINPINGGCNDAATLIILVCLEGELIALKNGDFSTIAWRSQIALKDKETIYKAAYDDGNGCIYLSTTESSQIGCVNVQSFEKLAITGKAGAAVPYGVLVSKQQADGREFYGITVDSQRQLFYACSYDDKKGDITIWQVLEADRPDTTMASTLPSGTVLIATIDVPTLLKNDKFLPYHCAFFIVRKPQVGNEKQGSLICGDLGFDVYNQLARKLTSPSVKSSASPSRSSLDSMSNVAKHRFSSDPNVDEIFVMAICHFITPARIDLFAARAKSIDDAILGRIVENARSGQSGVGKSGLKIGHLFTDVGTVASQDDDNNYAKLGSVFGPTQVFFDAAGNLFAAEANNNRIQKFLNSPVKIRRDPLKLHIPQQKFTVDDFKSLGKANYRQVFSFDVASPSLMRAVWVSTPVENFVSGPAIVINPKTNKPMALATNVTTIISFD